MAGCSFAGTWPERNFEMGRKKVKSCPDFHRAMVQFAQR
jgi:cold shock protein